MCARCDELEERVAWLEGELGLQKDAASVEALKARVIGGARNCTAHFILALYNARGRPMTRLQIMDQVPSPSDRDRSELMANSLCVWARKSLGRDAIETAHGFGGYRMTAEGLERVAAILAIPRASPQIPKEALTARSLSKRQGIEA